MSDSVTGLNAVLEGRYRIERKLGEGGMATVYLANDLRHGRRVALKVLKPDLAAVVGAERFLAEIKTTANLQHPHLLPLFDSGAADGFLFYAMPYVSGESLRDRLARERQLPTEEAVQIVTDVAEAIDYAHRQQVIHRDIKPANILLQDGKPVVSDFGIALAIGVAGGKRLTETGLSLGTPHYMSPEQATGDLVVGPATDIYALGCVLYELLVGDPPFTGRTVQAVLGKIVMSEPDSVLEHRTTVPRHIDAAIRKALQKVPADRFRTAADFADVLQGRATIAVPSVGAVKSTSPRRLTHVVYAGVLLAVTALTWTVARRQVPAASPMQLSIALPPGAELQPPGQIRLSSDGSMLVYTGPGEGEDDSRLWVRRWSSLAPTPIPNTTGITSFDPSPDNSEVVMVTGDSIRIQALEDQSERTIVAGGAFCCVTWGDDGEWVYFTDSNRGVSRVPQRGGRPEVLTTAGDGANHLWPQAVPGKNLVVFEDYGVFGIDSRLLLLDLNTGELEELGEGSHPTAVEDLVLFTNGSGTELRYTSLEARDRAAPVTIASRLGGKSSVFPDVRPAFDVSLNGHLLFVTDVRAGHRPALAVWVDRDGTETVLDSTRTEPFRKLRISPDGSLLALQSRNVIYVKELPAGPLVPLTRGGTINYRPFWAPDGSALFYASNRMGEVASDVQIFRVRPDGAREPEAVGLRQPSAIITPDGEWWVYRTVNTEAEPPNLMAVRTAGPSDPIPLVVSDATVGQQAISRDGRWLAYSSDLSGVREVYVRPFPNAAASRVSVTSGGGGAPAFSPSTDELFVVESGWLVALTYATEPTFRITGRVPLFDATPYFTGVRAESHHYDVAAGARRFAMARLLDQPEEIPQQMVLNLGFLRQLRAAVGSN